MAASKAKIGAALAALIAGGGAVALKTMGKAARNVDNVAASTSHTADNFAKLAAEAQLARNADEAAEALGGAANRVGGDEAHAWMSDATWADVKTNIAETFATEGASRTIEALHENNEDFAFRALAASSPNFALIPPGPPSRALEATGRSILSAPDALQILLNARTNPLMIGAVGDEDHVVAPDGTRVAVDGIHYLCKQSQVTCIVIVADDENMLIKLANHYDAIAKQPPGPKVSDWQHAWESELRGSGLLMTVTPYPRAEDIDPLLGLGNANNTANGEKVEVEETAREGAEGEASNADEAEGATAEGLQNADEAPNAKAQELSGVGREAPR